jgi:2-polyprenyl-3-methyl-5-hydroxy-6-metoxy-1,4-benzoquinol methylase
MIEQAHYHTQEINGEVVLGVWDHRPVMHNYQIALAGKSLIDVGCRDGLFSAYYSEAGAKVTAIDIVDRADMRERQQEHGFRFAKKSIYELDQFEQESFDFVFCGDVLQHLENPIGALRQLHHVAREQVFIVSDIHEDLGSTAVTTGRSDYPFLWGPGFVLGMMRNAGWLNASVRSRFQISGSVYPTRDVAMFHAYRNPTFVLRNANA